MNYIARAFQHTYKTITKHWLLVGVLILLQLGLFISVGYVGLSYQMKIFENIQGILDPIQSANYNATSLQEGGLFTTEYAKVYENYNSLVGNVKELGVWLAGLFLVGNGILWVGTSDALYLGTRSWKKRVQWWLGYGLILFYVIVQIAWAFITAVTWKECGRDFVHAFKRIHKVLLTLAINVAILGSSIALLVWVMGYESLALLVITSLIVVIGFVLTRLFWVAALQELTHEREL